MLILWTPAFLGIKNASIQPLSVSFISLGIVSPSHSTIISNSPSPDRLTSTENNSNIYITHSVFCVVTLIPLSYMAWILFNSLSSFFMMIYLLKLIIAKNNACRKIFTYCIYAIMKTQHTQILKKIKKFAKICYTQKNSDTCVLYFLHYLLWSLMLSSIMALSGLSTLILLVS